MTARMPRILITGFGPFPGAPENPTQWLVERWRETPPETDAVLHVGLLDVEYATIADQLARLCDDGSPDIAIHFGLAASCGGFRLERVARNSHAEARPDRAGRMPATPAVCAGPQSLPATLPLQPIAATLEAAGLPVEWSHDAGGYLCNTVMTLSLAHACKGLVPAMAGFVHVPHFPGAGRAHDRTMTRGDLLAGAGMIVSTCAQHWREHAS